jgi:serine-aspartate repeat-containing protein C/D/E
MEVDVGLFSLFHRKHAVSKPHHQGTRGARFGFRTCRIEQMESRQLLSVSAAPLKVATTYFEDSNDFDQSSVLKGTTTPVADLFEVSFTGGAAGSQLTQLRIDTDNTFFDTAAGGIGAYGSFPLTIISHDGFQITSSEVVDGGTSLVFNLSGFTAGEKLVFSVDVDEQGNLQPNAVAEGAEFEGATLKASFTAPHMQDITTPALTFYDSFSLVGTGLENLLPNDGYSNAAAQDFVPTNCSAGPVYTAAANGSVQQIPLPITLSGTVFSDLNANNKQETGDLGIAGVTLTLYEMDGGNYVATGKTALTDASGNYKFTGLLPGEYQVVETQPDGYLSVGDTPGTVGGQTRGEVVTVDILGNINLDGGDDSIHNDFAEVQPASLSGYVYVDANNNGVYDTGETPISGVQLTLIDAGGETINLTTVTNEAGYYHFGGLMPGTYGVAETQPDGYLDGLDAAGSAGGVAHNPGNLIDSIHLAGGVNGINYNFGELLPASISGRVFVDNNGNNQLDDGEPLLADVTIYLLDGAGNRIASTTTDQNGKYAFTDLTPGVYGVEEVQPTAYLEGGDAVGSAGGQLDGYDRILQAQLDSGVDGVSYDFWEVIPAKISGYVFQDGPAIKINQGDPMPNIPSLRDGKLTSDDTRLSGVTLELCDGSGVPLKDSQGNPITTTTDANGYYEFNLLRPGVYSIVEIQPAKYLPGLDTAGSKGGLVVNQYSVPDAETLATLAVDASGAAIVRIWIDPGDTAAEYNFSHVLVETTPPNNPPGYVPPGQISPWLPPPMPLGPAEFLVGGSPYMVVPEVIKQPIFGGGGMPGGYSWHLSVIDAGQPRQETAGSEFVQVSQSTVFDPVSWTGADLDQAVWILADKDGVPIKKLRFGMHGAKPVVGDWDGSGTTKIGVFMDGLWFLDLNGDGSWDRGDLWVQLGKKGDQPVAGDWNGDGKTDIGIFGPTWIGDTSAVAAEPGLPDADNLSTKIRPKNMPPDPTEAAVGYRTLKKGHNGKMRSDLVDHVFQYGEEGDRAVAGDWNGDGIYTIGVFRKGVWYLDMDGDGRFTEADVSFEFGQPGDIPVVGDWTGDGVTKVGVYRGGTFYLDTNNNRQLDPADKVIQLGQAGDKPVAGDWTGDGVDKVGVYEDGAAAPDVPLQAARP